MERIILHIEQFDLPNIGRCEIQVKADDGLPAKFYIIDLSSNNTICTISFTEPKYCTEDSIHLNNEQKKYAIDAFNHLLKGTFGESTIWKWMICMWHDYNDDKYEYDFGYTMPDYMLLPE